jgi:hypothetical protein
LFLSFGVQQFELFLFCLIMTLRNLWEAPQKQEQLWVCRKGIRRVKSCAFDMPNNMERCGRNDCSCDYAEEKKKASQTFPKLLTSVRVSCFVVSFAWVTNCSALNNFGFHCHASATTTPIRMLSRAVSRSSTLVCAPACAPLNISLKSVLFGHVNRLPCGVPLFPSNLFNLVVAPERPRRHSLD